MSAFAGEEELAAAVAASSSWGRWGDADELGALNLVGREQVLAAAAEVRAGEVVGLGLPLDSGGPQRGGRRRNPELLMLLTGTDHLAGRQSSSSGAALPPEFGAGDDVLVTANQAGTHVDALAHIFWRGQMYNGYSAAEVDATGAHRCAVQTLRERMVLRGVLADVAAHLGGEPLAPGFGIGPELLDEVLAAEGAELRPGDALLVRTGFLGSRRREWGDYSGGDAPGLRLACGPWLRRHDVAFLASDTWGVEVRPNEIEMFQPLHVASLVHGGICFGENFVLDHLGERAAELRRWSFLLVIAPLPITGACGSPVNPLAIL